MQKLQVRKSALLQTQLSWASVSIAGLTQSSGRYSYFNILCAPLPTSASVLYTGNHLGLDGLERWEPFFCAAALQHKGSSERSDDQGKEVCVIPDDVLNASRYVYKIASLSVWAVQTYSESWSVIIFLTHVLLHLSLSALARLDLVDVCQHKLQPHILTAM